MKTITAKKQLRIALILASLLMLLVLPGLTIAEGVYGSAAVTAGQTYTTEQMLTYALQDEFMAQAEYDAILTAYGNNAPFANIVKAEATHIALLTPLFTTYGLTPPSNDAAAKVTVPASLAEAYAAGVDAETANIAMYQAFLSQSDLPTDVRDVFISLSKASQSHLNAFTRNAGRDSYGMNNRNSGYGMGNRNAGYGANNNGCYGNGANNSQNDGNSTYGQARGYRNNGACGNAQCYQNTDASGNTFGCGRCVTR